MYTLSMIFNLHNEGKLAAKTIENLRNILNKENSWEDIEIVVVLDNPDDTTKNIVYNNNELFQKIEEELKLLSDEQHIVVFPQYYIEFPNLLRADYYESTDYTIQNNKFLHCFGSRISLYHGLLIKYKVNENKTPYGYEDWDLNNRLLANAVQFKISKHKLYYRRENPQSLLAMQVQNKNIVRNSLLYDFNMINTNPKVKKTANEKQVLKPKRNPVWYGNAKSNLLKNIYSKFINSEKKMVIDIQEESIFKDDIVFLENYGETVLIREDFPIYSLEYFSKNLSIQTKIYNQLMKFFKNKEMIYFFPWVVVGGADKVSVAYTKARKEKKSCVITSINSGVRIDNITIPHLDLMSELEGWESISEEDQLHILIKSIINSNIKLVHIVNSETAIKTVKYYDKVYKENNIKIIISLFCPEYHWENKEWYGYPVLYPEIFNHSDLIILDNHYWYYFFKKLNNHNDFNYCKLSSPTEKVDITYKIKVNNTKKILWASRICNQKLFEVFEEIVELTPEYNFIVYGSTVEGDSYNKEIVERLSTKNNVEFRGEYQHISEINLNEFDFYLFTSLYEGIPTTILDMIMAGIPIVTADVGGISEVLGKDYPLLVENQSNARDYILKMQEFYTYKEKVIEYIVDTRKNIIEKYNENTFQLEYNNMINSLLDKNNE